ncbi:hypothetical protein RND71_005110 [Anisodus tanguticus]|uniref:Uncharacterized protein n=1 Tax=Anisodus tanguticus TaxID=243964 RepID=A0AAE1SRS8_9SOLA|nr:hypothetical protein RND71_005110 [Anisodus tanguticus]
MKAQHHSLPFLLIMVILIVSQLSSCHNNQKLTTTSTEQRFKRDLDSSFSWHLSTPDPKASRNEDFDQSYRVSHHAVPGGPNPLHN